MKNYKEEETKLLELLQQDEEQPSNSKKTKDLIEEQIKTINKQKELFNEVIKNNKPSFNL